MKKVLLGVFVLLGLFVFSGCSLVAPTNNINTRISSIFVSVSYEESNLKEIGVSSVEKKEIEKEIETLSQKYLNKLVSKYRSAIDVLAGENILTANERIIYKNHLRLYTGWDGETFIMELRFHTATASRIFVKYCGEMRAEVEDKLFTTKVTERITDLMDMPESSSVTDYYNGGLVAVIEGLEGLSTETFKGVAVDYIFLSSNRRLHSEGIVFNDAEGEMHYFPDDVDGNTFTFYKVDAKQYVWYLLALTIAMSFVAGTLVVLYFKNGKKYRE